MNMRILEAVLVLLSCFVSVRAQTLSNQTAIDRERKSANATSAEPRDVTNPPPLGKLIDVGGYRVHLYCTGTGSPAVVIVGAGFSFNWGLVQPRVAKLTQVCSFDHSGIGWSDDGPKDSCSLRVSEVHTALKNAGIKGPYVVVGHSLGALVARLYAGQYPDEVAGMVFVDHAMAPPQGFLIVNGPTSGDAKAIAPISPIRSSGSRGPVAAGIESDPNFGMLSPRDRELHLWAMSQARNQTALQSNREMMPDCVAKADAITKGHPQPLGTRPLVDVSRADMAAHSSEYAKFQTELLSLSQNSKQIVAEKSGHFIIVDRPDAVIAGIQEVVGGKKPHQTYAELEKALTVLPNTLRPFRSR